MGTNEEVMVSDFNVEICVETADVLSCVAKELIGLFDVAVSVARDVGIEDSLAVTVMADDADRTDVKADVRVGDADVLDLPVTAV